MAHHLCSSPSFLSRKPQTPSRSLPSSSSPNDFRLRGSAINTHTLSFPSLQFQPRTSLQIHHVSLQDPVAEEAQNSKAPEIGNIQSPHGNSGSLSKSYIWVNPSNPRASQLRHKSNDSRFQMGITLGIYIGLQSRSQTQWSLYLKGLSLGAALTALHVWINDLSRVLESGEELPPVLGINTGHGKHKHSDKGLASVFESHLKELNAPFQEASDKAGWFLTTKVAVKSWLECRSSSGLVTA